MNPQYDKLTQLKSLLDSGTLTQEEFETAKKRILSSENPLITPDTSQLPPPYREADSSPLNTISKKWIILGIIVLLVIVVILIITLSGRKEDTQEISKENITVPMEEGQDWAAAKAEADAQFEKALANAPDINSDAYFENFNPWHIDYFKNEWGEVDTSKPMIYTTLQGSAWNIHIDYIPGDSQSPYGVFRFYLVDGDGYPQDMYGSVHIIVRGSDDIPRGVPVTGVRDGVVFVEDPETVDGFKALLNQEDFDIRMEFEKFNERHSTRARWESTPGFFQRAIDTML